MSEKAKKSPKKNLKPGIKTTEFLVAIFSSLMIVSGALKGVIDPTVSAILIASIAGIYEILRTVLKILVDKSASQTKISE